MGSITHGSAFPAMIVCSCNVLTDDDVRSALSAAGELPRTARQVYGCLGCSAQCGRCARTIQKIMNDALGACAKECCTGCPHSGAHMKHAEIQLDQVQLDHVKVDLDQMVSAIQA